MLYVALGRNVGESPMSSNSWADFQREVQECIYDYERSVEPDTLAYGDSHYGSMREETCVMVWFDINAKLSKRTVDNLAYIAGKYGQESIAWSVSETKFVEGVK